MNMKWNESWEKKEGFNILMDVLQYCKAETSLKLQVMVGPNERCTVLKYLCVW